MNQKFKLPEQTLFILFGEALDTINRGGSITIEAGYLDSANVCKKGEGAYVEYQIGHDKYGQPKAKRFKFDESFRKIQTRVSDKAPINGVSQYDFIKGHPACEDSPNARYDHSGKQIGVMYREYNPEKDAQTALDADTLRVTAQGVALGLDAQTLEEIANILGHYGEPDNAMRVRVIDFAGKRPSEFNELLTSGERSLRALVRKAINEGVFNRKGELIMWDQTPVGTSEDQAIAKLNTDQQMIDALKEKLQLKVDAKASSKSKGGRPRLTPTI